MRSDWEAQRAIERYADTVKRICFVQLKNEADTQDVFQNVFLKYVLHPHVFESEEHEKAWIIRVTINECKDWRKRWFGKTLPLDEVAEQAAQTAPEYQELFQAILALPEQQRTVIYLYYFEGYSAVEIGRLLRKKVNTIYTWLGRARASLGEALGGDDFA